MTQVYRDRDYAHYRKDSCFSRMAESRRWRVLCQRLRIARREGNVAIVKYCQREMAG